ncbi:MAG: helix-turn-helix transcriptional regulator [Solirubrobacteraceae bacterium]
MAEHTFTLMIRGPVEDQLDRLYDVGCDDATFGEVDGVQYAEFSREAANFTHAVASAIRDVESVDGLRVIHVEPEDLVTAAEIAERLGRSRESIRLLIAGERGDGDFPAPVSHLRARNRLWRWSDVAEWADVISTEDMIYARFLAAVNGALEMRNQSEQLPEHDRDLLAGILS